VIKGGTSRLPLPAISTKIEKVTREGDQLSTAAKKYGPASGDRLGAQAAGLSPFHQAVRAARELWLGAPAGELQSSGELENEAYYCSVINYYNMCFELASNNRRELEGSPAEFARSRTTADLSTFLRVTPLGGNERAREIDSNGRVREFVRHACGDYFDVVPSLVAEQSAVFLFPRWPAKRSFGSKIGQMSKALTPGAESNTLTIEETEAFILSAEGTDNICFKVP
jgi:hypothetical protein